VTIKTLSAVETGVFWGESPIKGTGSDLHGKGVTGTVDRIHLGGKGLGGKEKKPF